MIESLRAFAGSWAAKILLVLLVASFAVWGVQLSVFGGQSVARVGDEDVSIVEFQRAFQQEMNRVSQQVNAPIDVQTARALNLQQIAISRLALEKALSQEAQALQVEAPDQLVIDTIEAAPQFQGPAGGFDVAAYERYLEFERLRRADYEERVRAGLTGNMLVESVAGGLRATTIAAETIWSRRNEQRDVGVLRLTLDEVETPADPGEETLRAHHDAFGARFMKPEYRQVAVLQILPSELADPSDVTDAEIEAAYQAAGEQYNAPERRNLERLDFPDVAAAEAAAARLAAGDSFAALAAERDPELDIALGYVTKDQIEAFTPKIAEAAFAPDAGELVGPIETADGAALVKIAGVQPARSTPIAEVRDAIARELATVSARRQTPDLANDVEDQRAGGVPFEELAETQGVTQTTLELDDSGRDRGGAAIADLPADPAFVERVFRMELGDEMDLAQTPDLAFWAAEVTEVEPSSLRPFDEARADVLADWRLTEKRRLLTERAAAAADRLTSGDSLDDVAADLGVAAVRRSGARRAGPEPVLSAAARETAFAKPAAEATVAAQAVADGADQLVVFVLKVTPADPSAAADEIAREREIAAAGMATDAIGLFQSAVIAQFDFEAHQGVIDQALELAATGGY